jgi:hypothetical protein
MFDDTVVPRDQGRMARSEETKSSVGSEFVSLALRKHHVFLFPISLNLRDGWQAPRGAGWFDFDLSGAGCARL